MRSTPHAPAGCGTLRGQRGRAAVCLALLVVGIDAAELPGTVTCTWVGNTWPGRELRWANNAVDEIEVTPDGVVVLHCTWDENGRCIGLYRDGQVQSDKPKQYDGKGGHKAWGFGTAGQAIAVDGGTILAVNTEGELLRFAWTPPAIDRVAWRDQVPVGKTPATVGLAARGGRVALVRDGGTIELRGGADLVLERTIEVPGASDAAFDAAGDLWVLAGTAVRRYGPDGTPRPAPLEGLERPRAISVDPRGRLIVCEDGRRQQVLIYDVSGQAPRLSGTVGIEGGLRASPPGEAAPDKLFALRGAGADAAGNVYVAMGFGGGPDGHMVMRAFAPDGALRWQAQGLTFVNCYDVDPRSDGARLYGVDHILDLDLAKPEAPWRLASVTLDHVGRPDDPRWATRGDRSMRNAAAFIRWPQGRRLLLTTGMYAGGVELYAFPGEGDLAQHVGTIADKGWAWEVDDEASVWHGDAPGRTIRRWRFGGWGADGAPIYDRAKPESWPWPEQFTEVCRVKYVPAEDALYVGGYTAEVKREKGWGLVGGVLARFDGWTRGERTRRWIARLPLDDDRLPPKSMDVAGDFAFVVQVKPTAKVPALVSVLRTADGSVAGSMSPGERVDWHSGWVDMTHALRAFRRADGEYLVIVEEDHRAKNLLYRWRP